ncbi:MAG: EAL domain-containing protein [Deltaproteobacteria bacterium]|nr:EAL domain-containing protein [Deltaproteobacteria bacterium]
MSAVTAERRSTPSALYAELVPFGELRVVFQPLLDLRSGSVFAYEALVRTVEPVIAPPALFAEAVDRRCAGMLGRAIRALAVAECMGWPLFLNVHPNELEEGWLLSEDDPIYGHDAPVFLEITESVPLSRMNGSLGTLAQLRTRGVHLAVDDLGAGYSNLRYIADLAPEVVKLDRELVKNLSEDDRLRRLVRSIVHLCIDLDAEVVAEGIETREELRAVRESGVHYGQGYLIGRPAYPPPPLSPDGRITIVPPAL